VPQQDRLPSLRRIEATTATKQLFSLDNRDRGRDGSDTVLANITIYFQLVRRQTIGRRIPHGPVADLSASTDMTFSQVSVLVTRLMMGSMKQNHLHRSPVVPGMV
jgi:hypothetical protein